LTVRLTFLGTRGEIALRTRRHRRHSSLLVECGSARVMIDRGRDWTRLPPGLRPTAIVLTHGHDDHAAGLAGGCAEPVFATAETFALLGRYPIADRRTIVPVAGFAIGPLRFVPVAVEHSLRAPAVGYRVGASRALFFYAPDVAALPQPRDALDAVRLYIGDGAAMTRPILRRRDSHLIGHASIRTQLGWCREAGVGRAIFTHCGSGILAAGDRRSAAALRRLGESAGLEALLARDGLKIALP
jgi:phosphoribosyl 1,2-cyclic phosphodiesterase